MNHISQTHPGYIWIWRDRDIHSLHEYGPAPIYLERLHLYMAEKRHGIGIYALLGKGIYASRLGGALPTLSDTKRPLLSIYRGYIWPYIYNVEMRPYIYSILSSI